MSLSTETLHSNALVRDAARSTLLWKAAETYDATIKLFDLTITNATLRQTANDLVERARMGQRTRVSFLNAHVINIAAADSAYARVLAGMDRLYADGSGMALAARWNGSPLADNVNGTDLFPLLCAAAQRAGVKIFLLGGKPGVADAAAETVKALGHGDVVAGVNHGYLDGEGDNSAVIEKINASGASIVLVGMGVPVQDLWIARNAAAIQAPIVIAVGGLFDFFAGTVSRAPTFLRSVGCEWMWRLAQEPRRMWSRYLVGNVTFTLRALAHAGHSRLEDRCPSHLLEKAHALGARFERRMLSHWRPTMKRAVDVVGSSAALVMFSPIFLATAVAIKLDSPGPVFFSQKRVGKNGLPFMMLKFRSMHTGADRLHAKMQGANVSRNELRFKDRNDPRITGIGRFIRKYSIDELPQFWNVLTGEMSLVGPRPALPSEVKNYSPADRDRLLVQPGITCSWQVGGRANIDFVGQVELDRSYIRRHSIALDLWLLLQTPYAVLFGKGAY
jgi:exopolysaccharide biosynthesis WecB/TagA/CpsF family protein